MSESSDPIGAPRDRETALSVAYLRILGSTQADAAKAAGIDPRTVGRWESCSWWPGMIEDAGARWLAGFRAKTRIGLAKLLDADPPDPATVRFCAERLLPGFGPPTQKTHLTGAGELTTIRVVYDDD